MLISGIRFLAFSESDLEEHFNAVIRCLPRPKKIAAVSLIRTYRPEVRNYEIAIQVNNLRNNYWNWKLINNSYVIFIYNMIFCAKFGWKIDMRAGFEPLYSGWRETKWASLPRLLIWNLLKFVESQLRPTSLPDSIIALDFLGQKIVPGKMIDLVESDQITPSLTIIRNTLLCAFCW